MEADVEREKCLDRKFEKISEKEAKGAQIAAAREA